MTPIPPVAETIVLRRSGMVTWLEIDGVTLFLHEDALASLDVDGAKLPEVRVSLFANRVVVDNTCYVARDDRGDHDGEAQCEASQEATEDGLRLPENEKVSHP